MASQVKEVGEFSLVITEVDAGQLGQASEAFATAFALDPTLADQILKSAPIVFASKLTKSEIKAIAPKLLELSARGLEFRVTARLVGKVPKVNWPIRPQFTVAGSPGGVNGVAFSWDNNAFVCPSCGETFLFRRLGKLKLEDTPVAPASATVAPTPVHAPVVSKSVPTPVPIATRAAAAEPESLGLADDVEIASSEPTMDAVEIASDGEGSLDLPGAVEEIQLEDTDLSSAVEPTVEAAPEVEPVTPLAEPVEEVPTTEPSPAETAVSAGNGDLYNVFLSKITDRSKQDKAAELISKVKGCSLSEAKDLTTRLVIPIAKNISREQAEEIINQFKKFRIMGKITKVK